MDLREARRILSRITYKDGWTLSIFPGPADMMVLRIDCQVADATRQQSGLIVVSSEVALPPPELLRDDAEFIRLVFDKLRHREEHECMEWFQVDGVAPYYPHHG